MKAAFGGNQRCEPNPPETLSMVTNMEYPCPRQIRTASHLRLARWVRFLPNPQTKREKRILHRILVRFNEHGGMTRKITQILGLDNPPRRLTGERLPNPQI